LALDVSGYDYFDLDLLKELFLVTGFPWSVALDHLIENHTQGEDVALARVVALFQRLRRHVERSSNVDAILEAVLRFHCEAQIRNFPFVPYSQDVGRLQISVDHSFFKEILESGKDLLHNFQGVGLR
jgi:hypothetical protein